MHRVFAPLVKQFRIEPMDPSMASGGVEASGSTE
jgi:hypothetical protein